MCRQLSASTRSDDGTVRELCNLLTIYSSVAGDALAAGSMLRVNFEQDRSDVLPAVVPLRCRGLSVERLKPALARSLGSAVRASVHAHAFDVLVGKGRKRHSACGWWSDRQCWGWLR